MRSRIIKMKSKAREEEMLIVAVRDKTNIENDAQILASFLKRMVPEGVLIRALEILREKE